MVAQIGSHHKIHENFDPSTLMPLWYHITYINFNSSYLSLSVVICYLSFKPTSSTLHAPCSSIVIPVDGTNLISVWSQFRISFSGISSISNVALISSKFLSCFLQNLSQNVCSCCCSLPLCTKFIQVRR